MTSHLVSKFWYPFDNFNISKFITIKVVLHKILTLTNYIHLTYYEVITTLIFNVDSLNPHSIHQSFHLHIKSVGKICGVI